MVVVKYVFILVVLFISVREYKVKLFWCLLSVYKVFIKCLLSVY